MKKDSKKPVVVKGTNKESPKPAPCIPFWR